MLLIWGIREAKYFSQEIWTTQIKLNRLTKLDFWRTGIRGLPAHSEARKSSRPPPSVKRPHETLSFFI